MLEFLVARNPDCDSSLPFLIAVPLEDKTCWFKAADSYPRGHRVFCAPYGATPAINELEVVERIPIVLCCKRGKAIDLVLNRAKNRRSQFVTVTHRGRASIFWQTARTARAAKPGLRVPANRANKAPTLFVDTRERNGYRFAAHHANLLHRALSVGDYAVYAGDRIVGVVERKTLQDFANSLQDGSLNFAMSEMAGVPFAAVAVEGSYPQLLRFRYVHRGFLATLIARLQVRYPSVPINFLDNRNCAEEWTFRFLAEVDASGCELVLQGLR
jgi:hypothetical protein